MKLPQLATNLFVVENSSFLECKSISVQHKLKNNNKLSSGVCLFFPHPLFIMSSGLYFF